jgi:hypothetical protein
MIALRLVPQVGAVPAAVMRFHVGQTRSASSKM